MKSVAENIFLGKLPKRKALPFILNTRNLIKDSKEILKRLDLNINPREKLNNLSVGAQQGRRNKNRKRNSKNKES